MKPYQWFIFIGLTVLALGMVFYTYRQWSWDRRLQRAKVQAGLPSMKPTHMSLRLATSSTLTVALLSTLVVGISLTNQTNPTPISGLFRVANQWKMEQLVQSNEQLRWYDTLRGGNLFTMDSTAAGMLENTPSSSSATPDYIGTNVQVEGVDEGDIIKSNGTSIVYAARYQNAIQVLDVQPDRSLLARTPLDLGDLYTDSIYLTDEYLVVMGYRYEAPPLDRCNGVTYCTAMWWYSQSGAIEVYDLATLDQVYAISSDASFRDHRLIDDTLIFIGDKTLYGREEYRPTFSIQSANGSYTDVIGYQDIYYYDNTVIHTMSVFATLNLASFHLERAAYLGNVQTLYMNENAIYTTETTYDSERSQIKLHLAKYHYDAEQSLITFVAHTYVRGQIDNQFYLDEYNGVLRLVTSETNWTDVSSTTTNRLYTMQEAEGEFTILAELSEGLGKPNERVKSVRFQAEVGYVVTFEQTDPLYTINLSDPSNPVIENAIEETGYNTYMHPWGEDRLIGIGYSATPSGAITGIKVSAYDTQNTVEPLETYSFVGQDNTYNYSYSEALYNHKALLVSPTHGLLGFALHSYKWGYVEGNYRYEYGSHFVLFHIDFDASPIITAPLQIGYQNQDYNLGIERGIYIDQMLYVFSNYGVMIYDLEQDLQLPTLAFDYVVDDEA